MQYSSETEQAKRHGLVKTRDLLKELDVSGIGLVFLHHPLQISPLSVNTHTTLITRLIIACACEPVVPHLSCCAL